MGCCFVPTDRELDRRCRDPTEVGMMFGLENVMIFSLFLAFLLSFSLIKVKW